MLQKERLGTFVRKMELEVNIKKITDVYTEKKTMLPDYEYTKR